MLRSLVECHVASYPGHKVVESSHSVDVISRSTTKLSVVDAVRQTAGSGGQILAIGDRADDGGNDSELLSCRTRSVSIVSQLGWTQDITWPYPEN